MGDFFIDEEIDKLIDKFIHNMKDDIEDLKSDIKKAIIRSEKIVLKKYISSQKNKESISDKKIKKSKKNIPPRREQDYKYISDSDLSSN